MFLFNKNFKQFELVPSYNFYVDFTGLLPNLFEFKTDSPISNKVVLPTVNVGTISQKLALDKSNLILKYGDFINTSILVKSVTVPEVSITLNEQKAGPSKYNPGINSMDIDDITIEFYRDDMNMAKTIYYNWLNLMVDLESGFKKPRSSYEKTIRIFTFNRYGMPVEFNTCYGCALKTAISGDKFDANERTFLSECTLQLVINNGLDKTVF